jgi:hypothetical protein
VNTVAFGLGTVPDFRNARIESALGYRNEDAGVGSNVDSATAVS